MAGGLPTRQVSRYALAVFFVAAGANHFIHPANYLAIMPPYLPYPLPLVLVSGALEMALGAALLSRRLRRPAGWGLLALLVAVFPANVHMALHPETHPGIGRALLYARLPLQAVLMLWVWWTLLAAPRAGDPGRPGARAG